MPGLRLRRHRAVGGAIWSHPAGFDGLVWTSRQDDTAAAIMLFGRQKGRGVSRSDLEVDAREDPLPLGYGRGLDEVQAFADQAGIEIRY
jgi:hypothetical protein